MGFSHTTWTTPDKHECSRVQLPSLPNLWLGHGAPRGAVGAACRGGKGSNPRVHDPHYSLTLANGMGFWHTTWTTPPIHEHSGVGLPRATLTSGWGTRHPAGGKRDLQGGGGWMGWDME